MAAALFTLLALLCAARVFTGLDQFAVDEWMPGMDHSPGSYGGGVLGTTSSWSEILVPGWAPPLGGSEAASLANYVVVLAASALPSTLVVAGALWLVWRRGARTRAAALAAAFVLSDLAEVVAKGALERDRLTTWTTPGSPPRILPFDHSFPSGHTLRAWLMAACIALAWPHARRLQAVLLAWALAVPVMLVVGAWHTPTDVVGGVLLAVASVAAALALEPWLATRVPAWLRDRVPDST